jgi:hypothetical protein
MHAFILEAETLVIYVIVLYLRYNKNRRVTLKNIKNLGTTSEEN